MDKTNVSLKFALGLLALTVAIVLVLSVPVAFVLMLVLGGLHRQVQQVPALGFQGAWLLYIAARILFTRSANVNKSK